MISFLCYRIKKILCFGLLHNGILFAPLSSINLHSRCNYAAFPFKLAGRLPGCLTLVGKPFPLPPDADC